MTKLKFWVNLFIYYNEIFKFIRTKHCLSITLITWVSLHLCILRSANFFTILRYLLTFELHFIARSQTISSSVEVLTPVHNGGWVKTRVASSLTGSFSSTERSVNFPLLYPLPPCRIARNPLHHRRASLYHRSPAKQRGRTSVATIFYPVGLTSVLYFLVQTKTRNTQAILSILSCKAPSAVWYCKLRYGTYCISLRFSHNIYQDYETGNFDKSVPD